MDFVATISFWVPCIITVYYFFDRKPDTLCYSSVHYMSEKWKQYLSKLKKYVVTVSISTGLLICVPFYSLLFFEIFHISYSSYENLLLYSQRHPYIICFIAAGFLGWCIGLYFYRNKNIQHLQKLLEAMNDADYERFTETMQVINFTQCYSPFAVICQGKAYFMSSLGEGLSLKDIVHLERDSQEEYHNRSEDKYESVEETHIYAREQSNTSITVVMPRDQYHFLERAYREAFHKS